jgi:hypothetical protein
VERQALAVIKAASVQARKHLQLYDAFGIWASGELRSPPALK